MITKYFRFMRERADTIIGRIVHGAKRVETCDICMQRNLAATLVKSPVQAPITMLINAAVSTDSQYTGR